MGATEQWVAVLPDGTEHFGEVGDDRYGFDRRHLAQEAVWNKGITCPRNSPEKIEVKLYRIRIEKGRQVRHNVQTEQIDVPLAARTEAEFDEEIDETVSDLPPEFREAVKKYAWDEGHSNGFSEVLHYAEEICGWLEPAIKEYTKRITAKKK